MPRALPEDDALDHPHLFFNREPSTLDFNRRVLAQAIDERTPLLERILDVCTYWNGVLEWQSDSCNLT